MVHSKKKVLGFGLAAAGFFIIALLVASAAMGGDGGLADERIADMSVSGSGGVLAASAVNSSINYQGRLADSSGNPLSGTYMMTFRIYEASSGGTPLSTDTHSVTVTDGLFSTNVSFDPSSFDGRALWLGITIQGEASEMTPRQELRPVPYALSLRPGATINSSNFYTLILKNSGNLVAGLYIETSGYETEGVYALTHGNYSEGVYAHTEGYGSPAMYGYSEKDVGVYGKGNETGGYFTVTAAGTSWSNLKPGVNISTKYDLNPGLLINTSGGGSYGVYARTSGSYSDGVSVNTSGNYSFGVSASTSGRGSSGVYAETSGESSTGFYASTSGESSTGFHAETSDDGSRGFYASTSGYASDGVYVHTDGNVSDGVYAFTSGRDSVGVFAEAHGNDSEGVYVYSEQYYAIAANTVRPDHDYAFYTQNDNIYVGGKIDLVGTVDPIIVEGFNADPLAKYEMGDVVCLDDSGTVKACSKADDTRVVGVVGPTVELEDGEITVVIMGYQGAKPDEEHVQVLEQRLERAETEKVEAQQLTLTGKFEESERLDSEIAMLRSQLDEAKSVTRQVVRVKADASYSSIKAGDLLTTSATKGHAMKARPVELSGVEIYKPGTIIGKALEPLPSGKGLIEVFVTLQ